jgi:hypothetical protein
VIVARWIFWVAAFIGIFEVIPLLALEDDIFAGVPATYRVHLELYYGFVGVTFAWQVAFVLIGLDPVRLRPVMLAAIIEKLTFVIAVLWLYFAGRVMGQALIFGGIDLLFGILFVVSWIMTPDIEEEPVGYAPQ